MATEWSGLTPEVMMNLDRDASESLGFQLQNALRTAIRSGQIRSNERLPSSRKMASDLHVSRGLVQDAYEQLGAEGYLSASVGSGTRVAFVSPLFRSSEPAPGVTDDLEFDFSPGRPDLNSFPMRDWLWACGEVSRTASARDAGYGDARGHPELRRVVASYFQRVRGGSTDADNVTICSGFTQGAGLVLAALRARGVTSVAVEDPGHPDVVDIVRRAGMQVIPVPVDARGLVVETLNGTSASVVIVTAAHQTPTGVVLAPERRHALLGWAKERDGIVIEDDYDSEFRYDRQPVGALRGLSDRHVVTIGSVSKSLAPALRLGWIIAPTALVTEIADEKWRSDRGSPAFDQLVLAKLMESGRFDRHLRRMRVLYAGRRNALVEALLVGARIQPTGLAAGFHAVAALPFGADEEHIITEARRRSVGLQGLGHYRVQSAGAAPGIVFGFGDLNEDAIRRGIFAIADLLC